MGFGVDLVVQVMLKVAVGMKIEIAVGSRSGSESVSGWWEGLGSRSESGSWLGS